MNKVFIATPKSEGYMLSIWPNVVFKNWNVEYTFVPIYSWDLNGISWNVNDQWETFQKVTEKFTTTVVENWNYVVTAKWYKDWNLKAVAILDKCLQYLKIDLQDF